MLRVCKFCAQFSLSKQFATRARTKASKPLNNTKKVGPPIITCKRSEFNHYSNYEYGKFDEIPLASKGWFHNKSKSDFFVINPNVLIGEPVELPSPNSSFADAGLSSDIITSAAKQNIINPMQIQADGIPYILSGQNTLIAAETGCGKTFTYLLPMIQQITRWKSFNRNSPFNSPLGVILLPGRELAHQIGDIAQKMSKDLPFSTKVIIGGRTKQKMLNPSFEPTDLLIATLGAISKLVTTGIYKMNMVRHLVLDEADSLLDDSFNEKLTYFLKKFPFHEKQRPYSCQLTLCSATLPMNLDDQLNCIISPESLQRVTSPNLHRVIPHVPQKFMRLGRSHKPTELLKLVKFDSDKNYPVVIFTNKTETCDWLSMFLNENGVKCLNLNGDMPALMRIGKFNQFQNGQVNVISCTDIGSRGLDTIRVKHVINYDFPMHTADYIHRCGRTGRKGSPPSCHVTNFVSGLMEVELVQKIELSVRKMNTLPNVNGNITKVIKDRMVTNINTEMAKIDPKDLELLKMTQSV